MSNIILYLDKLNKHMEKILLDLAPQDVEVKFLNPTIGRKGSLDEATSFFVTNYIVTKDIIDKSPNLKLIQRTGVGVDNVDVDYARKKGIPVSISKGFNSVSVAELAILSMLALYRRLVQLDGLTKKGEWHTWTYRHDSYVIKNKVVGVLGAGVIGREVIKRLNAFEANVIYYDPYRLKAEEEENLNVEYSSFDDLIKNSDIITLHLPWLESTRGIIGREQFKQMKKSAILINTARGPIVDQEALVDALQDGEIWGAACDVYSSEPADPNDPLFNLDVPNLITTPHIGAATYDTYYDVFKFCINNTKRVENGEEPLFIVNK